jgi:hypothetical protein
LCPPKLKASQSDAPVVGMKRKGTKVRLLGSKRKMGDVMEWLTPL